MIEFSYENIDEYFKALKLDCSAAELATLAEELDFQEPQLAAIEGMLEYLNEKKRQTTIETMLRLSRLPLKDPKTFENFNFDVLKGKDIDKLKALPSLSSIYAHKNLAFIGPARTGKTHLAQAFGYECCQKGLKTYFIKMSELRDRFTQARRTGREASVINGLVRPSCLIIDEVGHCEFDKENTRLFFDMVDRRYYKEGVYNIVFTSNKNPAKWRDNFNEDDALLCALDRIFDEATVITIKGESFRGRHLEKINVQSGKIKVSKSSEEPTI